MCLYIYIYIYTHIHIHAYMRTYIHTHACVHTPTRTLEHTCTDACTDTQYVYRFVYALVCVCVCLCVSVCTCARVCAGVCEGACMHGWMELQLQAVECSTAIRSGICPSKRAEGWRRDWRTRPIRKHPRRVLREEVLPRLEVCLYLMLHKRLLGCGLGFGAVPQAACLAASSASAKAATRRNGCSRLTRAAWAWKGMDGATRTGADRLMWLGPKLPLLERPGVLHAFDVQHHRLRARIALGPEPLGPKSREPAENKCSTHAVPDSQNRQKSWRASWAAPASSCMAADECCARVLRPRLKTLKL